MAEYIEREAALNVCESHYQHCLMMHDYSGDTTADNIKTDIENIPAADVVEVVRCKGCKHRYVPTRCALWYATVDDKEYFVERGDDFYCSYGEAKMDGKGE